MAWSDAARRAAAEMRRLRSKRKEPKWVSDSRFLSKPAMVDRSKLHATAEPWLRNSAAKRSGHRGRILNMAKKMREGKMFLGIVVAGGGKILDGHHRYFAARIAGIKRVGVHLK